MGEDWNLDGVSLVPESEKPVTLAPGTVLGRYEVGELLHEGRRIALYRVRHNTLETDFALKVVRVSSPTVKQRLLDEGQRMAGLQHPNLVAVSDVLTVGDAAGIVMEMVDGPSLDRWLDGQAIPEDEALELFVDIARGVREAHNAGLTHGALTAAHVLIDKSQDRTEPKVTGFGTARNSDGTLADPAHPSMDDPRYAAPEQFADGRIVDQRCDVYALGCILHELLTGQPPNNGADAFTVLAGIEEGYTPPPNASPAVARLLAATLARTREDRPASAARVVELARPLVANQTSEHASWSSRRSTLDLPAPPELAGLHPPGATPLSAPNAPAPDPGSPPPGEERSPWPILAAIAIASAAVTAVLGWLALG